MSNPTVSVVLYTYLRPENLAAQVKAFKNQTFKPDKITIAHLKGNRTVEFNSWIDKFDIEFVGDPGLKSKFVSAWFHDSDYVIICDDDIMPGRKWIQNCISSYRSRPGIYGAFGFNFNGEYYDQFIPGRENNEKIEKVDFIGQSWFMKWEDVSLLFFDRPEYDYSSGDDDIWLGLMAKQNGVECLIPPHPARDKEKWGVKSYGNRRDALCRRNPKHEEDRKNLIKYFS